MLLGDGLPPPAFEEGAEAGVAGTLLARFKKLSLPRFGAPKKEVEPRLSSATPSQTIVRQSERLGAPSFKPLAEKDQPERAESSAGSAGPSSSRDLSASPEGGGRRFLIAESGDGKIEFPLAPGEYTIGRAAGCDFQINHRSLSREHARIKVQADKLSLIDLESANKTFVDDHEVANETVISEQQRIRFGIVEAWIEER